MEYLPFDPAPEQRANLEQLAAHLALGVTNLKFDMRKFSELSAKPGAECGTVACAAGHGPSLGIKALPDENWWLYIRRVFGVFAAEDSFTWLFDSEWSITDNTPRGAAARIRIALTRGIPDNADAQCMGKEPLSYTIPDMVEDPPAL